MVGHAEAEHKEMKMSVDILPYIHTFVAVNDDDVSTTNKCAEQLNETWMDKMRERKPVEIEIEVNRNEQKKKN